MIIQGEAAETLLKLYNENQDMSQRFAALVAALEDTQKKIVINQLLITKELMEKHGIDVYHVDFDVSFDTEMEIVTVEGCDGTRELCS